MEGGRGLEWETGKSGGDQGRGRGKGIGGGECELEMAERGRSGQEEKKGI